MKKRRLLTIFLTVVAALAVTGVALAFTATSLTSTGSIVVAADEAYSLDSETMAFGDTTVDLGAAINVNSAAITITNDGETTITSVSLSNINGVPDGLVLTVSPTSINIATDEFTTLLFNLAGTAPSEHTTLNLTTITCDLLPSS